MPTFGPIKRERLIYYLRRVGFSGPHSGRRHQFMLKGHQRVRIPNPHKSDIGKNLLTHVLRGGDRQKRMGESLIYGYTNVIRSMEKQ